MTYTQMYVENVLDKLHNVIDSIPMADSLPKAYERSEGPSWEDQVDAAMRDVRDISKHIHEVLTFSNSI